MHGHNFGFRALSPAGLLLPTCLPACPPARLRACLCGTYVWLQLLADMGPLGALAAGVLGDLRATQEPGKYQCILTTRRV